MKRAQMDGLEGYPVYTRKVYTDVFLILPVHENCCRFPI
ncbi:hypothetical protein [Providencia hangzhouensis]